MLPGETQSTHATGVYSGQAVFAGYSLTAGTVYHVTGTFAVVDASDGKVVKGQTDAFIGIKGHSGRGGGNTYTLVNGTISLKDTGLDGTLTSVNCSPSTVKALHFTTCTVTVTDLVTGATGYPTGKVVFSTTSGYGSFKPGSCYLSSGSCSVEFKPLGGSSLPVYAEYRGDSTHYRSSGRTQVYVTGSP
jgi:hypothetical protein